MKFVHSTSKGHYRKRRVYFIDVTNLYIFGKQSHQKRILGQSVHAILSLQTATICWPNKFENTMSLVRILLEGEFKTL